MLKQFVIILVALSATVGWAAQSDGTNNSSSASFAVLDPMAAILSTKEAKKAEKLMKNELKADQKRLKKIEDELAALGERYKRDEAVMTQDEKADLQKSIREMQDEGKFIATKLQKRVQEERQAILTKMQPKLNSVLESLVKERQFSMIMNRQAAIYTSDSADITNEVADRLNKAK